MIDFHLLEFLGFGGIGLTVTVAVLALFWKADDALSDEAREALSQTLQRVKIKTGDLNWAQCFEKMFDRIFGGRYPSWKCFGRSCVASILSVLVLLSINILAYDGTYENIDFEKIIIFFMFSASYNLIPDYLSLLETRWVVGIIKRHGSLTNVVLLIIIDIILTAVIFFAVGTILFFIIDFMSIIIEGRLRYYIIDLIVLGVIFDKYYNTIVFDVFYFYDLPSFAIFFYSTLFTSAWIWLFVTGWFVVSNGTRFQKVLAILQFILPIKTKPMRAIGEVAAVVTAVVFLVFGCLDFFL